MRTHPSQLNRPDADLFRASSPTPFVPTTRTQCGVKEMTVSEPNDDMEFMSPFRTAAPSTLLQRYSSRGAEPRDAVDQNAALGE